jgi:hypothetical protein
LEWSGELYLLVLKDFIICAFSGELLDFGAYLRP